MGSSSRRLVLFNTCRVAPSVGAFLQQGRIHQTSLKLTQMRAAEAEGGGGFGAAEASRVVETLVR